MTDKIEFWENGLPRFELKSSSTPTVGSIICIDENVYRVINSSFAVNLDKSSLHYRIDIIELEE